MKLPKENFGSSHQRERKVGWSAFGNQREVQCLKVPLTILQSPHIQYSPIGSSIAAQFESSAICSHATVSFLSYTCLKTEKKQKMKQHVEKEALHSNCKAPHNLRSAWECIPSRMNCWHKAGKFHSFDRHYGQIASWWFPSYPESHIAKKTGWSFGCSFLSSLSSFIPPLFWQRKTKCKSPVRFIQIPHLGNIAKQIIQSRSWGLWERWQGGVNKFQLGLYFLVRSSQS